MRPYAHARGTTASCDATSAHDSTRLHGSGQRAAAGWSGSHGAPPPLKNSREQHAEASGASTWQRPIFGCHSSNFGYERRLTVGQCGSRHSCPWSVGAFCGLQLRRRARRDRRSRGAAVVRSPRRRSPGGRWPRVYPAGLRSGVVAAAPAPLAARVRRRRRVGVRSPPASGAREPRRTARAWTPRGAVELGPPL